MASSRAVRWTALLVLGPPCVAVVVAWGELSTEALVAVAVTGAVLAGVGLAQRAGEAAPAVGRRGLPWLVWAAAALAWELLTLAHDALPTLSDLLDPVLAVPVVRGVATAAWLAAGAWLLARPHREERSP